MLRFGFPRGQHVHKEMICNRFSRNRVAVLLVALILTGLSCACTSRSVSNLNTKSDVEVVSHDQNLNEGVKNSLPLSLGLITDYADVFDPESKRQLESLLMGLRERSGIEFAVLTVESTGGQPIFDYSLATANAWGIGSTDPTKKGGILLVLAVKDRQWRLQVSRSLESDLPDEVCKQLGDQSQELYRAGRYAEGITKYVNAIIKRLEEMQRI